MRRLFAISDLHIGGAEHPMLGHPEVLVDFLERVAAIDASGPELVVHGDFVDFLAESPYQAWTPDEATTLVKLRAIFARNEKVFDAFAKCARGRLTILLGNHDVELAYPKVREALFARLGTTPHNCLFVHSDEGYRVGDVFIEHGNRYDPWNAVEFDELQKVLAAVGRGEAAPAMQACPGSSLVEKVMNPLKERYHFIDLLKPEDKIVMLLLLAFEPEQLSDVKMMFHAVSAWLRQKVRPGGRRMRGGEEELTQELRDAFADELRSLQGPVGTRSVRGPIIKGSSEGLANVLRDGRPVDPKRAAKLQLALCTKVAGDVSFATADDSGDYTAAARAMTGREGTRLVIMGHTHLARDVLFKANGGRYFNTGTWADLIRVDDGALRDRSADRGVFIEWLRRLVTNDLAGIRVCSPGYADVTVGADGHIVGEPGLRIHELGAAV